MIKIGHILKQKITRRFKQIKMELNQNQLKALREICREDNTGKIKYSTALSIIMIKIRRPDIKNVEIANLLQMSQVNISRYSPVIKKYFELQEDVK